MDTLRTNLANNCVPDAIFGMNKTGFEEFLKTRRTLMAAKIRGYYEGL
jgi:hypothetical protein